MKILFIIMEGIEGCLQHIKADLEKEGHGVKFEIVPLPKRITGKGAEDPRQFIGSDKYINGNQDIWDLIVWCDHERCEPYQKFQRNVKPAIGNLSLEHDILTLEPEYSRHNNVGVFAFTKPHYDSCTEKGLKPIKARWYKIDMPEQIEAWFPLRIVTAIWIGSNYPAFEKIMKKDEEFEYADQFQSRIYKAYGGYDTPKKGFIEHAFLHGARATRRCADIAKYWIMIDSSSYLDALMFGCIPVIYDTPENPYFTKEKDTLVDGVLSRGYYRKKLPIYYISYEDLPQKMRLLEDEDYCNNIIEKLKEPWLFDNYKSLPTVTEEILKILNK